MLNFMLLLEKPVKKHGSNQQYPMELFWPKRGLKLKFYVVQMMKDCLQISSM